MTHAISATRTGESVDVARWRTTVFTNCTGNGSLVIRAILQQPHKWKCEAPATTRGPSNYGNNQRSSDTCPVPRFPPNQFVAVVSPSADKGRRSFLLPLGLERHLRGPVDSRTPRCSVTVEPVVSGGRTAMKREELLLAKWNYSHILVHDRH